MQTQRCLLAMNTQAIDAAITAACAPNRFWCKLHTLQLVDSHNPTLPLLVKLYEQLLQVRGTVACCSLSSAFVQAIQTLAVCGVKLVQVPAHTCLPQANRLRLWTRKSNSKLCRG